MFLLISVFTYGPTFAVPDALGMLSGIRKKEDSDFA
jgi:hypothetical protein